MKNSYYHIGGIFFGLMFTTVSIHTKAQTRTISGTVTTSGKPLQGVIISQDGSDQVTTTGNNGTYTLQVSAENPILLFRHPDYAEEKFTFTDQKVVNISLEQKVKGIEEVILNAGYYKVKDKERTGSIAKVSAKDIENQPVNNVLSAAQGRMAGVSITQNSGTPGGGFDIQIRGRNSLRTRSNSVIDGNQPLYIIDGVPVGTGISSSYAGSILPNADINPLNSINPNDIESFEILKDADATAIYGSRGANGVVLVTTKKGKRGKVKLTLNSSYGLSHAISNLKMMNTAQYLDMRKQAFANSNISVYPANAYDINGTWDSNRYTDWRKELIGHYAALSNTQLSLSGGGENTNFLLSLGHHEQTTVFGRDFRYRTNTISGNISHRSADRKFSFNSSNIFTATDNNLITSDATRQSYILAPNAPALYDSEGNLNWENNTFTNPAAAFENSYSNNNLQFLNNISMEYEAFKNFKLKLNGGLTYQTFEEWSLRPSTAYSPSAGATSLNSMSSKSNQNRLSMVIEPQISWMYKTGNHKFDVQVGGTYQRDVSDRGEIQGSGFESNALIYNIGAAINKVVLDQISTEYRYGAFFGRINYQYDKKYILNLTGRRDGSSRFGPNNKYAIFGAIGAAWLFSEEDFMKNISWLSFGKLRGSYGSSGSDNIGDYQYLDTFATANLIYNGSTGLAPTKLYNPDFSWERTIKTEAALELGLFNNRLNLSAAYYRNRSGNQLVGYQLSSVTGFSSVLANLDAVIQNTGLEFEASGKIISKGNFSWSSSFNITIPRNKLISFPGLEGSSYANTYVIGQPVNIVKIYQLQGVNPNTFVYDFTDFNGDGKIASPDDRQVIRNLGQQFYGGLSNELRYRNWNLSFLLQFVKQQSRNYNSAMSSPGIMANLPVEALNVWSPSNPNGLYMPYRSTSNSSHSLFQNSDASVSDASFIRLKNVQLTYNLSLDSGVFREVKLYFQGQNLLTWTEFFGIDPEMTTFGFLPPLKTYSFGIQLTL
ncbi:SusC/RagA family TonB-linked outer membrane protein [Chryseobacterium sp. Y16C]|uniref:SusC/RagA family TonB-linked outer membrane protein n=1 Tax=Chryseobacterium sp. Y16C TaxID=2920939 RepID=UPI001F0A2815|nr:SusC/RagA family TonB-linked outer membrane protein [Chryseobacterium sp. Y16C]UMQ43210.1 SusC/RagA family TonB-linked outer membrane protein [Chryseobacterium sp. Y16C]